jgi:hypothetical protein
MTTHLTAVGPRAGAPRFTAGWIGVLLFAAAVLLINRDSEEIGFSVVLGLIVAGVMTWYRLTTGRAAVVAGLVLGLLFTLQQALFVASDVTSSDTSFVKTTLVDVFGLGAGLLIVAGSIAGLAGSRGRARPE